MIDNKQNSETENTGLTKDNKTTPGSGAFSTKQAKDTNPLATNKPDMPPRGDKPAMPSVGGAGNTPKDTMNKTADSVGAVTTEAIDQVKDKATSVLGEQKTNLASGVASVADSIRQVGENLGKSNENNQIASLAGKYGDSLAGQVEKFSSYIEDKDFRELMRDVEQFARRNPALFVGGAFALGVFAARFFKSSNRNQSSGRRMQNNRSGNSSTGGSTQSSGV
jgi:hypothetical protein